MWIRKVESRKPDFYCFWLYHWCLVPDPEVLADVEDWKKSLANYSSKVIGKTLVLLNGDTTECRFRECNLGNLICDAMVGLKVNR